MKCDKKLQLVENIYALSQSSFRTASRYSIKKQSLPSNDTFGYPMIEKVLINKRNKTRGGRQCNVFKIIRLFVRRNIQIIGHFLFICFYILRNVNECS